uniref:Universal stress protein n=1 Tax=Fundidesulfovibrio putealis TaxID=270496 RepID=A0A7C4A826_9BACT
MKIMACIDLSPSARDIVAKAVELALWKKAELVLFSVAEDFMDFGEDVITPDIAAQVRMQAQNALDAAKIEAKTLGVDASTVMELASSPADAILDYAAKAKVDLIITGSRAKTGLDRFLIGSVASKVVSHAGCSVLVIR